MSWPTSQTENRLRESLIEAGSDFDQPDLRGAIKVFRRFVSEPVECADDGVLFECGTYGFTEREAFSRDGSFCDEHWLELPLCDQPRGEDDF